MRWLLRRFKLRQLQSRFTRSVALLVGGTALGQAVVVLATPILTRLYTPADFGVFAVYTSILTVLIVIAALRYELAIPLPEDDEDAANLLLVTLSLVLLTTLLVGIGVWLLGERLVSLVNAPALKPYLWLIPLGLLGAGAYQAFSYWAIRRELFTVLARAKVSQGFAVVLTQVMLGLLKLGPIGLLLGHAVGYMSRSGTLLTLTWTHDKQVIKRVSVAGMRRVASRYRRFPIFNSGSSLLNSAGIALPPILLATFYGPQVAGFFALGYQVIVLPAWLIGRSVSDVYIGEGAQLVRTEPHALERLFYRTAKNLALIGALPAAVLLLAGPWLFELVFGEAWREAGVYAQLMAIMFLTQFVTTPLEGTLVVLEQQGLGLRRNAIRLVLVVGSLWLAQWEQWEPKIAVALYSLSMTLMYINMFIICKRVLRANQTSVKR
jgi:O-antigen/teichoic acid export membrane protein